MEPSDGGPVDVVAENSFSLLPDELILEISSHLVYFTSKGEEIRALSAAEASPPSAPIVDENISPVAFGR